MISSSAQTYLTRASHRISLPQIIVWKKSYSKASFLKKDCLNTEKKQIQRIISIFLFHPSKAFIIYQAALVY